MDKSNGGRNERRCRKSRQQILDNFSSGMVGLDFMTSLFIFGVMVNSLPVWMNEWKDVPFVCLFISPKF